MEDYVMFTIKKRYILIFLIVSLFLFIAKNVIFPGRNEDIALTLDAAIEEIALKYKEIDIKMQSDGISEDTQSQLDKLHQIIDKKIEKFKNNKSGNLISKTLIKHLNSNDRIKSLIAVYFLKTLKYKESLISLINKFNACKNNDLLLSLNTLKAIEEIKDKRAIVQLKVAFDDLKDKTDKNSILLRSVLQKTIAELIT